MINLKADLYTLIKATVGAETVIWAHQNGPRPALPHWTIRALAQTDIGTDGYSQGVDALGNQTVTGMRETTVQIQRYGVNSEFKVAEFRDNLSKTTVREQWRLKDLTLYDFGPVQDVPFLMDDDHFEPRAVVDLFVRYGIKMLDNVGIIETVITTGEFETIDITGDFDANPDLEQTITVTL